MQERVRRLRYVVPPLLAALVVAYQLGVANRLESTHGPVIHYSVEIIFYSLAGPVVTWLTLAWVERRLAEKEALEQQIHARNRHLASLTNASVDAILSLNRAGRVDSWNRGAEQAFGWSAAEMLGQPLARLLPDAPQLLAQVRRAGVVQNFETVASARDGREIPVDLTHTLLAENAANDLTSSLILRDITPRREREAMIEEERARIARDLHDGVAQVLYLLALKADMTAGLVESRPGQVRAELQEIGQRSRQVIREIRRTIFALRPLDWSAAGFVPALQKFVEDFAEQLNWQVEFSTGDGLSVPHSLQPTVFRLVQESLNNAAKHAHARRVWVALAQDSRRLNLVVRDDGAGFIPPETPGKGLGLRQMRRRAEAVGGGFRLDSRPGGGTSVTAWIPLEKEQNNGQN